MQTISGPHTDPGRPLGDGGLMTIALATLAVVIVVGLTLLALSELLAVATDPVQVAPVRWGGRF